MHSVFRLLLLLLTRFGLVRIIQLSPKGRITQFLERTEPFARRKRIRLKWFPPILIGVHVTSSPNEAVEEYMADRMVFVDHQSSSMFSRVIRRCSNSIPDQLGRRFRLVEHVGPEWEMPPSLRRVEDWTSETDDLLKQMGAGRRTPFVLLALRDAAYYSSIRAKQGDAAGIETSSDFDIRNPNPLNYLAAVKQLKQHGFEVIYFGYPTSPLPPQVASEVIDYSGQFRTERGDLLLGRACTMLLSGASGAWTFAKLFDRPIAFADNYPPVEATVPFSHRDRLQPVLYWSHSKRRLLTFREMMIVGLKYTSQSACEQDGVVLIKNSPEELAALALEVIERNRGSFVAEDRDMELSERFSALQAEFAPGKSLYPIASTFLRKYADLLD